MRTAWGGLTWRRIFSELTIKVAMEVNGGRIIGQHGMYRSDDVANVLCQKTVHHHALGATLQNKAHHQWHPQFFVFPPSHTRTSATTALVVSYPCLHHPRLTARARAPQRSEQQDKYHAILADDLEAILECQLWLLGVGQSLQTSPSSEAHGGAVGEDMS